MPIKPELRQHYGKAWRETRRRILERAGNRCERCGKPDGAFVLTQTGRVAGRPWMIWRPLLSFTWSWLRADGSPCYNCGEITPLGPTRTIRVILTVAHLDRTPGHDHDDNLAALCQSCHLYYDRPANVPAQRRTRQARKDAARPLLEAMQ
jgi:hypothetical protein